VSFRLEPDGDGTRLVFEHSGFDLSQPWNDQAVQRAEFAWAKMLERFHHLRWSPAPKIRGLVSLAFKRSLPPGWALPEADAAFERFLVGDAL